MKKYFVLILPLFFLLILSSFKIVSNQPSQVMSTQADSLKNGGVVFFKTTRLDTLSEFYTDQVGCSLWLDQGACKIFRHGNMLFGFCRADEADLQGVVTFFYPSREQVDAMYEKFKAIAKESPRMNERFNIYHFYAEDPEGRLIEFQYFNHPLKPY
jgi:hypothetical protein